MNSQNQHNVDELLAAYALGALDLEDRPEAEALLASSPERQEELRRLREVVALLPYAAQPITPPDRVRQALMARVTANQEAPPPTAVRSRPAPRRRPWLMPAFAATLAVVVLALAGLTFSLSTTVARLDQTNRDLVVALDGLQSTLAETQARQETLAGQLAEGQRQIQQVSAQLSASEERMGQMSAAQAQDDYVISFVSAPGVATRQLTPSRSDMGAQGEMYMYPGNPNAVVLFSGLPTLAPGQVYQFWLADGTTQVAGGTFIVDEGGMTYLVVEAPREVNAFREVMVTVEPEGGSASPSQTVILEGSL
jgi:anti-sigma-K factor RskA